MTYFFELNGITTEEKNISYVTMIPTLDCSATFNVFGIRVFFNTFKSKSLKVVLLLYCKDIEIPRYNLEYVKNASIIQLLLHGTASPSVKRTANLPAVQNKFKNSSEELNKHEKRLLGRAANRP